MMQKVHAHGKCILAGEHSIVRGGEAIVLPLLSRNLEISWHREVGKPLEIQPGPLSAPFQTALACALEELNQSLPHQDYSIALASSIPVKAGLGSSAALAVATVRFLEAEGLLVPNPFQLALKIEDLFHGTSSGIDVACALHSRPLLFSKQRPPEQLKMSWQPKLYLADTGLRSSTKDCVRKVAEANRLDLDEKMREAVEIAKQALHSEKEDRLDQLAQAIRLANSCFEEWDLGIDSILEENLRSAGAIATKPTGSGGGGYALALFASTPSTVPHLIPVGDFSLVR